MKLIHAYVEVQTTRGPEPSESEALEALSKHLQSDEPTICVNGSAGKFTGSRVRFVMGDAVVKRT